MSRLFTALFDTQCRHCSLALWQHMLHPIRSSASQTRPCLRSAVCACTAAHALDTMHYTQFVFQSCVLWQRVPAPRRGPRCRPLSSACVGSREMNAWRHGGVCRCIQPSEQRHGKTTWAIIRQRRRPSERGLALRRHLRTRQWASPFSLPLVPLPHMHHQQGASPPPYPLPLWRLLQPSSSY